MKDTIQLSFQFKGERTYIHGTDIFNAIAGYIKTRFNNITKISLSFHNVISSQVDCFISKSTDSANSAGDCLFRFESNGTDYTVVLKSNGQEVSGRYPYPEDKIVELCEIDGSTISLKNEIGFSNIEKIVAMNKALMESLFKEKKGKWYFSKLTLDSNFDQDAFDNYSLTLVKNMGARLTKTAIQLNDKLVGYIYFSLA